MHVNFRSASSGTQRQRHQGLYRPAGRRLPFCPASIGNVVKQGPNGATDRIHDGSGYLSLASRCIYENNDILVEHHVVDFEDGNTEAVLAVHLIKDGKIIRTETGATSIDS